MLDEPQSYVPLVSSQRSHLIQSIVPLLLLLPTLTIWANGTTEI